MKLGRLFRTLRHLKPQQLFFQAYYRLLAKLPSRGHSETDSVSLDCQPWPDVELSKPCGASAFEESADAFCFIGIRHVFDQQITWAGAGLGKLWDYNLHYFEWIWGLEPASAKKYVLDWIDGHQLARGAVGWEPYPTSLRIMNWIGYWGTVGHELLESDPDFRKRLIGSLSCQSDWLGRRLERHLLGNHYFENGAALYLAGAFMIGPRANSWLRTGSMILEGELHEQVLPDGMHFERSPMYHNRLVHVLEWLNHLKHPESGLDFDKWLKRTRDAASKLCHPDGKIALFNDSAFGIYPEQTGSLEDGAFALRSAGYYGSRTSKGDYMICDAGAIGPDYLPGHAHCDVGSFELSIRGHRVIVDTGVYHYESSERRHYSRSTVAHNTFGPVGVEQAEIWGSFRVGNRPVVTVDDWQEESGASFVLGLSHDGFSRALGVEAPYHRRFDFDAGGSICIEDIYDGPDNMTWAGHLHFALEFEVSEIDAGTAKLQSGDLKITIRFEGVSGLIAKTTPYYPEFNTQLDRTKLEYIAGRPSGTVRINIDWKADN